MKFERINGDNGYGVKVILEEGEQLGMVESHSKATRNNLELVERYLNRMESDLSQQLSEILCDKPDMINEP